MLLSKTVSQLASTSCDASQNMSHLTAFELATASCFVLCAYKITKASYSFFDKKGKETQCMAGLLLLIILLQSGAVFLFLQTDEQDIDMQGYLLCEAGWKEAVLPFVLKLCAYLLLLSYAADTAHVYRVL
jgi:ABC-type uncharacterized transport system permease subunit